MRRILVLVLLTALTGCRRSEPPPEPPLTSALPAKPAAPEPPARPAPEPARPQPPQTLAASTEVPPQPAAEAAQPAEESEADRLKREEEEDRAIYTWTDAQGTVHFGSARDAPAGERPGIRKVEGGDRVMVVPSTSLDLPPSAPPQAAAEAATEAEEPALAPARGPEPQLDADGLPIPGTMDDTAHTRAVKQATGVQLDPASVERRHQEELRKLKCRVVDGVTICG